MKIRELKPGQRATITGFEPGSGSYRHQLMSMGLTRGASLTLSRIAPLGDPIEICVRGYSLTLRKAEASILEIEPIAGE